MSLCPDCGKEHYDIVGEGVAVLIPETIKGCPAFKRVAERKITMSEPKTLRDEFEKLCPVPDRAKWDEEARTYIGGDQYRIAAYRSMYQGFLLGRQNTVSVEKYQEVWNAYVEAKRRTEEV